MTLRTLNYGNYGIFLIMGNAGFCPSTVLPCKETLSKKATYPVDSLGDLLKGVLMVRLKGSIR